MLLRIPTFFLLLMGLISTSSLPAQQKDMTKPDSKTNNTNEIMGRSLDGWLKELTNKDAYIRETAIRTLPSFGNAARKQASPIIVNMLKNEKDYSVRMTAVSTMPYLIDGDDLNAVKMAVDSLTDMVRANQLHARYEAVIALGNCGPFAKSAIPAIVDRGLLDKTSWQMRKACCTTLGKIAQDPDKGPDTKALEGLMRSLNDECAQVRRESLQAILQLGTPGTEQEYKKLIKELTDQTRDRDKSCAIWSHVCLMRLSTKKVDYNSSDLQAVARYLRESDTQIRTEAIQGLAIMANEASSQIPALKAIVDNPKEALNLRMLSLWAMSQMGESASELVPYFEKWRSDKDLSSSANEAIQTITGRKNVKKEPKAEDKKDTKKEEKKDPKKK